MKLFRHGPIGQERPGTVDAAGVLRDLSGITDDFAGAGLDPARLARVRDLDLSTCPPHRSGFPSRCVRGRRHQLHRRPSELPRSRSRNGGRTAE